MEFQIKGPEPKKNVHFFERLRSRMVSRVRHGWKRLWKRDGTGFAHHLGSSGKTYSKPSSGHTVGGRSPGQTHKKPKDLSVCEEREHGVGTGVYVTMMSETL